MPIGTARSFSLSGESGGERMRIFRQMISLALVIALFAGFNVGVYGLVTSRCANNFGTASQLRSIDAENYRPFDEQSRIVKHEASLQMEDDLPVLDGATALLPVYAAVAHAVYPADSCPYDETGYLPDSAVQYRNTVGAYKAVVDGTADIVFCAEASEEQKAYAAEQGVELVFQPIGHEAFVFFVNAQNPVEDVTQEQIRGIYAGQITNWREVGGSNRLIHPIDRQPGSGSQSAMLRFMGDMPIRKSPFAFLGASIGFSFRYYVEGIVADSHIKMLKVDGVEPSAESIRSGAYPVVSHFYAVYRKDDPNPNVKLLVDWLLTEEGQRIINESGYVGLI